MEEKPNDEAGERVIMMSRLMDVYEALDKVVSAHPWPDDPHTGFHVRAALSALNAAGLALESGRRWRMALREMAGAQFHLGEALGWDR